ncbi:MAG: YajQ family cyclic di-GMP-binding protein [Acidobacteria bacterium]|nr:YajQ family cyclic di-GMP-binding protein [Acidobacteriota bacterium]
MPSFDVVSEVNMQEVLNAVSQATREVDTRFDFKGKNVKFNLEGSAITMTAPDKFQLSQMYDVLTAKMVARKVNVKCLERDDAQENLADARQVVKVRQGIESDLARRLIKVIKDAKVKVQVAIQEDQLRVSGKKRDVLQEAISLLKAQEVDMPLQFTNFRD